MAKPLTPQRLAFVREYLANGRNATAAHRVAYPGTMSGPVRSVTACNLLKDPRIAAIVAQADRRAAAVTADVVERYAISKQRIADALARIAFAEPCHYLRVGSDGAPELDLARLIADGCADLVELVRYTPGGSHGREGWRLRINMPMRYAALIGLARLMGYFRPDPKPDPPASDAP